MTVFTDNMTAMFWISKVSRKYLHTLSFFEHFITVKNVYLLKLLLNLSIHYINTHDNPADKFTRMTLLKGVGINGYDDISG